MCATLSIPDPTRGLETLWPPAKIQHWASKRSWPSARAYHWGLPVLNLFMYKLHALRDYVASIWQFGPSNGYSLQRVCWCASCFYTFRNSILTHPTASKRDRSDFDVTSTWLRCNLDVTSMWPRRPKKVWGLQIASTNLETPYLDSKKYFDTTSTHFSTSTRDRPDFDVTSTYFELKDMFQNTPEIF